MGILYPEARMIWQARLAAGPFREILTIGHQFLYLHPREVRLLRKSYRSAFPDATGTPLSGYVFGSYSDDFLKEFLGADSISILDCSSYEGANIVHDLNRPVPGNLTGRFDAVIDGGSLEHVFNFPIAIANTMRMLKVGGSLFIANPANNLCGHGFYQFSPELMFRVFTPTNGFELKRVALEEADFATVGLKPIRRVYEVVDPVTIGKRVCLQSNRVAMIMVEARKTSDVPLFETPPQQSDYAALWKHEPSNVSRRTPVGWLLHNLFRWMPTVLQNRAVGHLEKREHSLSNSHAYRRLTETRQTSDQTGQVT